jgi:hypothetical protein
MRADHCRDLGSDEPFDLLAKFGVSGAVWRA